MGKVKDFKFGVRIDRQAYPYFYNFGTPLYLWNG